MIFMLHDRNGIWLVHKTTTKHSDNEYGKIMTIAHKSVDILSYVLPTVSNYIIINNDNQNKIVLMLILCSTKDHTVATQHVHNNLIQISYYTYYDL